MKIISKRPFISSKRGIGNVPEGRIMDIDDDYADMLIKAGLAEEYPAAQPLKPTIIVSRPSSFISPVEESIKNGQSSPADQALPKRTAKKLERGGRRIHRGE